MRNQHIASLLQLERRPHSNRDPAQIKLNQKNLKTHTDILLKMAKIKNLAIPSDGWDEEKLEF